MCPLCRARWPITAPAIKNRALDNIVQCYVNTMKESGQAEWRHGGELICDWEERQE